MQWFFIFLTFQLLNFSLFSQATTSNFRKTIAKYGNTDKDSDHSYVESYEKLLSPYIDKPCNLLEIGVNFGGSAIMWYEHLPLSTLYLLDISNVIMPHITSAMDPRRWRLYIENAYTPTVVTKMERLCPAGFDIIIDDGPHSIKSQQFALYFYLPLLKNGGVLIIEDVASDKNVEILKKCVPNSPEFELEVIDLRQIKGRYDDILFVVRRANKE